MAGNYDELMARKAELEAEAARVAAEQAALANANGADVAAAATSEFDNNVDLVQSQQARMLSQSEPWLLADNFKGIDTAMASDAVIDASANYQLTDQFESPFDAASNQFDLMTDANGYPLDGHTMDSIKKATDAKVAEVHARPKTEPAIYPEQAARYPSKGYLQNPDLYRKVHGDVAADDQLRLYNLTDGATQTSAFDELVVAASENETLIAEKESIAKKAEQFKDEPGFSLYQRNRTAFIKQYGQDKADFYDIALGKNKTVLAKLQKEAEEKGFYDANGFNQSELGSALNFKATAADTSSTASMVADAQAKFNTETEAADQEFMTTSFQNIIKPSSDNYRDEEGDEKTTTAEIKTTAEKIFKGSDINPNEATKQLAELPKLQTQEDKANWLSNIRSFYSENPEIAHAMVRAAAAYLRTGKWYEAAAAGLEGGIEGAGVKYAKDQHALAAEKAELSRQEGLRGKYTAASVNAYLESGNIRDLVIDRAQEASTLRNTYTGPSVNAYIKSGDPEDLIPDFAKIDKNHQVYLNELKARGQAEDSKALAEWYNDLDMDGYTHLEKVSTDMIAGLESVFADRDKDNKFKNFGFGIKKPELKHFILEYANDPSNGLLVEGPNGQLKPSLENIPLNVITDMESVLNEWGEQQFQGMLRDGLPPNRGFAKFAMESIVRTTATRSGVQGDLLNNVTKDGEEVYAGESTVLVKNVMSTQIRTNKDFDFDNNPDVEGKQKPTEAQIWGQLQKHWDSMSPTDEERANKKNIVNGIPYSKDQLKWVEASGKIKDMPTSPFLEFARMWISKGDQYGFFKDNGMELFQEPK